MVLYLLCLFVGKANGDKYSTPAFAISLLKADKNRRDCPMGRHGQVM